MSEQTKNNFSANKNMNVMNNGPGKRMDFSGKKPKNTKGTLLRILKYIEKDMSLLIISIICVFLSTTFNLLAAYMLRPIVNGLVDGSGFDSLLKNLILMGIIYTVSVIANFMQIRFMLKIAQNSLQRMRNDLFSKMQAMPLAYFDTNNNGDIMSRFTNDIDSVGEMLSNTGISMLSAIITITGTFIIMICTNIPLTIVTILMIPVFFFSGKFVTSRSRKYFRGRQETLGNLNGYIEEIISGQKVVQIFNHEATSLAEFDEFNTAYRKKAVNAQFLGALMGPLMNVLGHLNYVLTALVGGLLCLSGKLDIGGLNIFLIYSKNFSRPINEISMQMNIIYAALAGAERVFDMMDVEAEPVDSLDAVAPTSLSGFVRVNDVNFGYTKDKLILKNISLYAKPGQKVAFVGSTGAGKTTITNLFNRFYDIDGGNITIDDIDIKDFKKSYLRQNIAMVLQDTHLFDASVMENIRYGRLDATDEEVIEAAKAANAHSFISRLEHGYNTKLESDGGNLSQGQRQLLNIARAAISKAPILVLDEATSSIDTRTEKHIEVALDRLMANRTTFVIAHRLSTVRNANVIIVLENGEIIERGDHDELLTQKGRYYELYEGITKLA